MINDRNGYCICIGDTDKIDDLNSLVQLLVIIGLTIVLISIVILWLFILEDIMSINVGVEDDWIIGVTNQTIQALSDAIREALFGKRKRKRKDGVYRLANRIWQEDPKKNRDVISNL